VIQFNKEASTPFISTTSDTKLRPWDIPYLLNLSQVVTSPTDKVSPLSVMSEYFPLKDCLQSIIDISKLLFGISFELQKISPEESWVIDNEGGILSSILGKRNDDILKYKCIDESGELLGTVYLDLFQRYICKPCHKVIVQ
jgi:Zn-dependent oligopeptidase